MATTDTVQVDPGTAEVTLHDLTIHDAELADYLAEHEPDEQAEVAERALKVGLMTLQLADTSKDLEYVKREFEAMQSTLEDELTDVRADLEDRFGDNGDVPELLDEYLGDDGELNSALDDAFGDDGQLTERLDAELGEDGERIQEALDPDREGTPTNRLRSQLTEQIDALREQLAADEAVADERQRSPKGGDEFEATVAELLDDLVYGTNDEVRHTGDEEGELPGEKVGDHVLTLGETGQRIVIESKSDRTYTQPKIKDELDDALDNRAADVAIFVSECESYIPNKVGYFQEFDKDRLAVSLSQDEDDTIDAGFLHIAVNWARMRAIEEYVDTDASVDTEAIQARVENIQGRVGQVSEIKKKCSSIEDTAETVKSELDALRDDVTDDLHQITAELSKDAAS